jgi:hypothetical protein
MSPHQLSNPKANDVYEKLLIRDHGRGASEKIDMHSLVGLESFESVSLSAAERLRGLNEGAEDDRREYRLFAGNSNQ